MKPILVTGATRGLGIDIARVVVDKGFKAIATGRKITPELTQLIEQNPEQVFFIPYDFSDIDNIQGFLHQVSSAHGYLYGLVNNAALGHDGVLATMHESQIEELIRVNVLAPIVLTKYASRSMLLRQEGRIVNISSIIASTGFNGLSVYGSTKSALEGFTKSLSRELGKVDITVNCVAPGYMNTDMTKGLKGEKLQSIIRRSPMKKLVSTRDVAHVVAYLMSEEASMITGTTVTVDAGSTA